MNLKVGTLSALSFPASPPHFFLFYLLRQQDPKFQDMSDPHISETGMQMQGGCSSSSGGGNIVVGVGGDRVNKEIILPVLMVLKRSLEEEMKQVRSLINMVHGEEVLVEDDQIAQQHEIQRKALADEQDKTLELEVQLEIMKIGLSCGLSGISAAHTSH